LYVPTCPALEVAIAEQVVRPYLSRP
jgi:hypothetical protein